VKAGDESQTRGRDYNGQVIDVKVEGGPKAADDLRKLVLDLTDQVPGQPRDVRRVDDPIIKFIIGLDGSTFSWSAFLKLEPGNNLDFFVHTIEERRKLAQPDGASDDPVMSKIHLTNVDRNEDKVSKLMWQLQQEHQGAPLPERVLNLMWHRLLSRKETIERLGWVTPTTLRTAVKRLWADGRPKESPWGGAGGTKEVPAWSLANMLAAVDAWDPAAFAEKASTTSDMHEVLEWLAAQRWPFFKKGIGSFTGGQIVMDLGWIFPFDPETWKVFRVRIPDQHPEAKACRGSGSPVLRWKGIDPTDLAPNGKKWYHETNIPLLIGYARELKEALRSRGIELTMLQLEHWMCEVNKIIRTYDGVTKSRELRRKR